MIRIENVTKVYTSSNRNDVCALNGVNASFSDRGLVCIVGKSGCGKTTLLNCLGTLDSPTEGKILVGGHEKEEISLTELSVAELDSFRNKHLGVIFQDYNLVKEWTVEQNLRIVFDIQEWTDKAEADVKKRIEDVLRFVELEGVSDRYVKELSGGQQQRVAIGRAIIKDPKLILADEPTGNLDNQNSEMIMRLLRKCAESCLVIVVTHDLEMAQRFADTILHMRDGVIVKEVSGGAEKVENVEMLASRDRVEARFLPASAVMKLSLHSLYTKRLKVFFFLLTMTIVIGVANLCAIFRLNNEGEAVASAMKYAKEPFLYVYKDCNVENRAGLSESVIIRNSSALRMSIENAFGKEHCYPMIEDVTVSNGENEYAVKLVLGGRVQEGFGLEGAMPKLKDEIVVTDYLIDTLGMPKDCIGSTLQCGSVEMTICGIVYVGVEEYKESSEYEQWGNLYALDSVGTRLIVSDSFPQMFLEQESIILPFAGLNGSIGIQQEMQGTLSVSSASLVERDQSTIIEGRFPENDAEIMVSADYASNCLHLLGLEDVDYEELSFMDIYGEEQNGVLDGYLSLHSKIPEVRIVGIVENETAAIYLTESLYKDVLGEYADKYYANSYEIELTDTTRPDGERYSLLLDEELFIEGWMPEWIHSKTEEIQDMNWVYTIALCVMTILLFLLLIIFFAFNVKDNYMKIGVLKSLGVSGKDIAKIWTVEAVMVTLTTCLVSFVFGLLFIKVYNSGFSEKCGFRCEFLNLNWGIELLGFIGVLALTVLVVLMPVSLMNDKKPMELLRRHS